MIKSIVFYTLIAAILAFFTVASLRSARQEAKLRSVEAARRLPDDTQ